MCIRDSLGLGTSVLTTRLTGIKPTCKRLFCSESQPLCLNRLLTKSQLYDDQKQYTYIHNVRCRIATQTLSKSWDKKHVNLTRLLLPAFGIISNNWQGENKSEKFGRLWNDTQIEMCGMVFSIPNPSNSHSGIPPFHSRNLHIVKPTPIPINSFPFSPRVILLLNSQ